MSSSSKRVYRACVFSLLSLLLLAAARVDAASVTIAWDPNREPDIAGYRLLYGLQSGQYSVSVDVGYQTQFTLPSLPDGRYYFAVQAYNTAGFTSPLSSEISAVLGTSAPPPTSTSGGCSTPDPFVAMGGGTCYNGGWLAPGMSVPGSTTTTTTTTTYTSGGCTTPDPFVAMGGGTCYNGGWFPPGMTLPGGSTTTTAPAPTQSPTGCPTSDPYINLGGGTCVDGNWVPPTIDWQTCATPDPFVSIQGLIGICINGGWIPVSGIGGTGVMHFSDAAGVWSIRADDGNIYVPLYALNPALLKEGQRVAFKGVPRTDLTSAVGIMIEIVTIVVTP